MPIKDKAERKAYQAAWFKRNYVPHPKVVVILTDEERRAKHRADVQDWRNKLTQEERDEINTKRRAKRRSKRVAAGLKVYRTKDSERINREHDERLRHPFPVTSY